MNKIFKRTCLTIIVVMLLSIVLVIAVSCDEPDNNVYAHVSGFRYDKDTSEVTAIIMLTNEAKDDIKTLVTLESFSASNGVFYNKSFTTYTFDGAYFYGKMDEIFTSEVVNHDNILYENLKFKFEYATLYKSIQSDGIVTMRGSYYIHSYELKNGEMVIHLTRTYQNSAAWYSILIALAIVVFVIAIAIALFIKKRGNYGKKEE